MLLSFCSQHQDTSSGRVIIKIWSDYLENLEDRKKNQGCDGTVMLKIDLSKLNAHLSDKANELVCVLS